MANTLDKLLSDFDNNIKSARATRLRLLAACPWANAGPMRKPRENGSRMRDAVRGEATDMKKRKKGKRYDGKGAA